MKKVLSSILVICLLMSSQYALAAETNSNRAKQQYNTTSSSSSLTSLKAVQENDKLFICVTGKKITDTYTLFIDKDPNEKSGTVVEWWAKASGVDFKITDDKT